MSSSFILHASSVREKAKDAKVFSAPLLYQRTLNIHLKFNIREGAAICKFVNKGAVHVDKMSL